MNKISLFKSGWFYLWALLFIAAFYAEYSDQFNQFEAQNLAVQKQLNHSKIDNNSTIRIVIAKQNAGDISLFQSLLEQYPNATFGLISELDPQSIANLNQLDASDTKNMVLLAAARTSSAKILNANRFSRLFIYQPKNINWIVSANLNIGVQPVTSKNTSQIIWRQHQQLYPSFVTTVTNLAAKQTSAQLDSDNWFSSSLSIAENKISLGLGGEIYPLGNDGTTFELDKLNNAIAADFNGTILLDDLSIAGGSKIHNAILSVQQQQYLTVNLTSHLIQLIFLLALFLVSINNRSTSLAKFSIIIFSILLFAFVMQFALVSLKVWLPLQLTLLVSMVSLLVQLGFNQEAKSIKAQQAMINQLLSEVALDYYSKQKMQLLLPFLYQTIPNTQLIEKTKEIAIQAEAHQNFNLAKSLYQWIISNDRKNLFCAERLAELEEQTLSEDLDQTMVIDGNTQKQPSQTSNLMSIKSFGRYQVEGILGKGAMGVVFQGVDPKINRHVAIKTLQLNDELDSDSFAETKQRFFREAETAGNLSHANIVTIYDVGEQSQENSHQSLGYIAMDLLTGAPLSEFVKKGKLLPPSLVYQLMIQMTDALDYAHRQKVIHRDIKPANIIFDDDLRRGTLTDFGIAYMSDHSKTKTGTIMGSPYYMSPEQVTGLTVDGRSDIFSLGVTFYQLLCGHLPFNGESIASVAFHITKTKHDSVRNWNKKLPTSAARITNKAMQKSSEKRYQSMQEFKQALINALKRDFKKLPIQ